MERTTTPSVVHDACYKAFAASSTASAWPGTFTLRHSCRSTPPESIRNVLRSTPMERFAANPINVTAMMRVGGRPAKEALAQAAASILRRSMQ